MNKTRKSFTIIELLVVISVIAILVSMLLPALNKARGKALETACLNRQKQIYLALCMYAQDFEGMLPPIYSVNYPTRFGSQSSMTGICVLYYGGKYINDSPTISWQDRISCPARTTAQSKRLGLTYVSSYFWHIGFKESPYSVFRLPSKKPKAIYLLGDTSGISWDYGLQKPGIIVDNHVRGGNWLRYDGAAIRLSAAEHSMVKSTSGGNFKVPPEVKNW